MKLFINDIPVILEDLSAINDMGKYDVILDGTKKNIPHKKLIDDVIMVNASPEKVDQLFKLMTDKKFKQLDSITFGVENKKEAVKYIKSRFTIVEAAGGVVEKDGRLLLIYRLKKWDLPKGKLEKKEGAKKGAVREVEEETGVKVELGEKVCKTWHTYTRNKKYVLKKTHWYAMGCLQDDEMAPQTEEGIDDVRWMNISEVRNALYNSYRTIRYVIQEYNKLLKKSQFVR